MKQRNIEAVQAVDDLEKLKVIWENTDLSAPDTETISRAKQQILTLDSLGCVVYDVYPGNDGEIVITLKNSDKEVDIILYPLCLESQLVRTSDTEPGKQVFLSQERLMLFLNWLEE